ncbi:MAG: sigma-70 family RNA polymerase sigma factor, partial [Actinomycetota bacterium]|nr:sigma-70 family RNA polymerase sigma factor [Actinomycetota bacterium]
HRLSEEELWRRRDEDPRAREELIVRYLPFARKIASRYGQGPGSTDDLIQVASLGLVNAVERFDPSRGCSFASFASPTIFGELKRYFRDRVWMIRVPRGLQEEIFEVDKVAAELGAELHREPTDEEIELHGDLEPGTASRVASARHNRIPVSLDTPADEDGQTWTERFGSEDGNYRLLEDTDEIRKAMSNLSKTERLVMNLRFIEDLTQTEIADRVGCSQMHVSRLLRRSISTLQERVSPD